MSVGKNESRVVINTKQVIHSDGFRLSINMEALHLYAILNQMEHLSYSLVRACFIRDHKHNKMIRN